MSTQLSFKNVQQISSRRNPAADENRSWDGSDISLLSTEYSPCCEVVPVRESHFTTLSSSSSSARSIPSRSSSPTEPLLCTLLPAQMPPSVSSSMGSAYPSHPCYYLHDKMAIFLVEGCLFRVHRYFLDRESDIFPQGVGSRAKPIELPGVTKVEFENLLDFFYEGMHTDKTLPSLLSWNSLLSISLRFSMQRIRTRAISEITTKDAFKLEEADKLGMKPTGLVTRARNAVGKLASWFEETLVERVFGDVFWPAAASDLVPAATLVSAPLLPQPQEPASKEEAPCEIYPKIIPSHSWTIHHSPPDATDNTSWGNLVPKKMEDAKEGADVVQRSTELTESTAKRDQMQEQEHRTLAVPVVEDHNDDTAGPKPICFMTERYPEEEEGGAGVYINDPGSLKDPEDKAKDRVEKEKRDKLKKKTKRRVENVLRELGRFQRSELNESDVLGINSRRRSNRNPRRRGYAESL